MDAEYLLGHANDYSSYFCDYIVNMPMVNS